MMKQLQWIPVIREPLAIVMNARGEVPRCPKCDRPTHASESNDDGVCVPCLGTKE